MSYLMRSVALTCLLFMPAAGLAENERQGTVNAKFYGEKQQWFAVFSHGEPTSTYSGGTYPEEVTIKAFSDPNNVFAGSAIIIDFSVVGEPTAPEAKWAKLYYNPQSSKIEGYEAEYNDLQVTITTIDMNENRANVTGSFAAKMTWKGFDKNDRAGEFSTMEDTFQVEVWPFDY